MSDRKLISPAGSRQLLPSTRFQLPPFSDLLSLVRAPAALSVPGDILAGAAAAGRPLGPRTVGTMASSVCLYWAGMALNDYADAAVDAVERPPAPRPLRPGPAPYGALPRHRPDRRRPRTRGPLRRPPRTRRRPAADGADLGVRPEAEVDPGRARRDGGRTCAGRARGRGGGRRRPVYGSPGARPACSLARRPGPGRAAYVHAHRPQSARDLRRPGAAARDHARPVGRDGTARQRAPHPPGPGGDPATPSHRLRSPPPERSATLGRTGWRRSGPYGIPRARTYGGRWGPASWAWCPCRRR